MQNLESDRSVLPVRAISGSRARTSGLRGPSIKIVVVFYMGVSRSVPRVFVGAHKISHGTQFDTCKFLYVTIISHQYFAL